jgi:hypothetical protein
MNNNILARLCQIYTLLLLLGATITSELSRFLPALFSLLLMLAITVRPLTSRYKVAGYVVITLLAPLVLAPSLEAIITLPPLVIQLVAIAVIIPIFYLMDNSLKQNTLETRLPMKKKPGIYVSTTLVSLSLMVLIIMLVSTAVSSQILLFTSIAFILYLAGVTIGAIFTMHRAPLATPTAMARIIAGAAGDMTINITNPASEIHCQFGTAEPWLKVVPLAAILKRGKATLNISYTPPLAGNSCPQLLALAKDLRGFIQICQILQPLQLQIIPRARYAEWLARKYLEKTGAGAGTTSAIPDQFSIMSQGGTDYRENRNYQPGDPLKDTDWKHTLQLNQLIIKDYASENEAAAIIAVNLSAADAEEADRLSFNLITAALTLARDNIPAALTAYNYREVVLRTNVTDPTEILRQALLLLGKITPVATINRYLEPTGLADVKRNIIQLKQVASEPAQRLLDIFDFKYRSMEEFVKNHPAAIALSSTTKGVPAPATILLVSPLNHDAEAIKIITDKLSRRRFTTVPVETPASAIPR